MRAGTKIHEISGLVNRHALTIDNLFVESLELEGIGLEHVKGILLSDD